ncbi:MAG: hypothetical protein NVS3B20_13100 [Polyangiales bacterium]
MSSSFPPDLASTAPSKRGHLAGTSIVGAIDWYIARYGPSAAHTAVALLPPEWRGFVQPNAMSLGILGAKKYPYAFVGALIHGMGIAVRVPDEDAFVREVAKAGADAALNTVARVALRYVISPTILAARAQEAWDLFHDSGRLVNHVGDCEYLTEVIDWVNHDVVVCKLCEAVCGFMFERMGLENVTARRLKCRAWGHDSCVTRVRWGARALISSFPPSGMIKTAKDAGV